MSREPTDLPPATASAPSPARVPASSGPYVAPQVDPAALRRHARRLSGLAEAPWLQREIARRMGDKLELIRLQPDRVLDWWPSEAQGSVELMRAYPSAERVLLLPRELQERPGLNEAPGKMRGLMQGLARAMGRRLGAGPVRSLFDASVVEPGSVQLVWANLMLHAVPDMPDVLRRWHAALAVDGFLMFSSLGPDTLRELQALYRRLGWGPPAQRYRDMHDVGDMLVEAGFADPVMDMEKLRLTWGDVGRLLDDLRAIGGNLDPARFPALRTPRWRTKLQAQLDAELRGPDGLLSLSFEVIYGHAVKPLPRARLAEQTRIDLDDMRAMVRAGRLSHRKKPDEPA